MYQESDMWAAFGNSLDVTAGVVVWLSHFMRDMRPTCDVFRQTVGVSFYILQTPIPTGHGLWQMNCERVGVAIETRPRLEETAVLLVETESAMRMWLPERRRWIRHGISGANVRTFECPTN